MIPTGMLMISLNTDKVYAWNVDGFYILCFRLTQIQESCFLNKIE